MTKLSRSLSGLGVAGSCKNPRRRDTNNGKNQKKPRSMSRILLRANSYEVFGTFARKTLKVCMCERQVETFILAIRLKWLVTEWYQSKSRCRLNFTMDDKHLKTIMTRRPHLPRMTHSDLRIVLSKFCSCGLLVSEVTIFE